MPNSENITENDNVTHERPPVGYDETAPPLGARVLFVESGQVHAADVCFVNDDETLNLNVLGHEGYTFTRTNVKRAAINPDPKDAKMVRGCEQRWFWPPRV